MECWRFWGLLTRHHILVREEAELEEKRRRDTLLTQSRAIFFGLQHNQDIPPSREDIQRQKKGKDPDWGKLSKARQQRLQGLEVYMTALSCHYEFERYMGWMPLFDAPPEPVVKSAQTIKDEVAERERRMIEYLEQYIKDHPEQPLD